MTAYDWGGVDYDDYDDYEDLRAESAHERRAMNHVCPECGLRGCHAPGCPEQDDEEKE